MHKKPGFLLIITFMLLSGALASVMLLFVYGYNHTAIMSALTKKCYTLDCALAAPDILKSLLTPEEKDEKSEEKTEKTDTKEAQKRFIGLLKYSQNFVSILAPDKESKSLPISYSMMLGSEHGKINLNGLYDFKAGSWASPEKKDFCKAIFKLIEKYVKAADLFDAFEKYLKKRGASFNDVSELYTISEFAQAFPAQIIYKGPSQASKNLYLGEIFTVSTQQDTINCVGLSRSLLLLIGAKQENMIELLQQKEKMQEVIKLISQGEQGLATFFDKVYGVELKNIPQECKSLLTMNFELNIFSIVVTASAQKITSTVCAIIKQQTSGTTVTYDVMKVYQV